MSKRLWTLPIMAAVLLALGSTGAFAIGSLGGGTGIVSVPNANIAPQHELDLSLTYQSLEAADASQGEDFTVWSLQALTGITKEAELWAAYSSVRDGESTHIWGLGGKLQLAKEPEEAAALAVGGSYQKWADAVAVESGGMYDEVVVSNTDATITKLYIVATKDFTPLKAESWEWGAAGGTRMYGSLGLIYVNVDSDLGDESLTRPFVAFEFVGADDTALGLEYRWKDDDVDAKAVFSAVLRHRFSPEFTAEVGTTNASPVEAGLDDQDFFVRLGYTIPMGAIY